MPTVQSGRTTIHFTEALAAHSEMSISACVKLMREQGVGSLLIVNAAKRNELVGIFTERDLLTKIEVIESGNFWGRPIRTVMTKPVKSLKVSEIHKAAQLMLKHGFRHVPIVDDDPEQLKQLVGVVSMRDLFQGLLTEAQFQDSSFAIRKARKLSTLETSLAILSGDVSFVSLIKHGLKSFSRIDIVPFAPKELPDRLGRQDRLFQFSGIVLDIDHYEKSQWQKFLQAMNAAPKAPFVMVVFESARHDELTHRLLEKLAHGQHFAIFEKPVSAFAMLSRLASALSEGVSETGEKT
ncbi:MAG: CBS domain-containing protein [Bacteriovoracia bacterium]